MKKVIFTLGFAVIALIGYSQNTPANNNQATPTSTNTAGAAKKPAAAPTMKQAPKPGAPAAKPATTGGTKTGEKTADGKEIMTGPKGGKYYMKDGKKVYIKRDSAMKKAAPKAAPAPKK